MKLSLTSSTLLAWLLGGGLCSSGCGALPDPTHQWTFNDGDAIDSIAGIVGETSGSATFSSDVMLEGDRSLYLPCCDSEVILNDDSLKESFRFYTVSIWFRAEAVGGRRYLYEEGAAGTGLAIRLDGSDLEAAVIEGGGGRRNVKAVAAPSPIQVGKWHLAVLTYDNGELSITLDGTESASTATGFGRVDMHSHPASIGGSGLTDFRSDTYFEGYVDDVRMYDDLALDREQIEDLFAVIDVSPVASPVSVSPGDVDLPDPTHRWTFNGGDATDSIGGIVGERSGSATFSNDVILEGAQSLYLPCCDSEVKLDDDGLKEAFTFYTVSLWFRAERTGGRRYLYEEGAAGNGIAVRLNGLNLEAAVIEGGGGTSNVQAIAASSQIEVGTWHHAALTYANGDLSISLDESRSETVSTGFGELSLHSHPASIGGGGLTDFRSDIYFEGYVDDVRIYDDVALTREQVGKLFITRGADNSSPVASPVSLPAASPDPSTRPNFLLIIGDDVNYDSAGFMGGVAPNVTPTLDALASQSRVFTRAHAANSVCQPSRQAMLSGKYPPNYTTGPIGFYPMGEGTATVASRLHEAGYFTAAFNKLNHMVPESSFPFDITEETPNLLEGQRSGFKIGRSPTLLGEATKQTIRRARNVDKPFFLIVNSADTHKPFAGTTAEGLRANSEHIEPPSRYYDPDEVTIPAPLPNLPDVREKFAQYASSMRRLDDTVKRCLEELEASGQADNTVVMYMSDNGMPMPFGKFETYRDSLSSPLVIRWPLRFSPAFDNESLVSLVDIAPTIIDMAGARPIRNTDGRSLVPLIDQEPGLVWRDVVVGTRYEDVWFGKFLDDEKRAELRTQGWEDDGQFGNMKRAMNKRGITDGMYHYIYNHFYNASQPIQAFVSDRGNTWEAMLEEAETDADMAARVDFYTYRAQEELYNTVADPGSERNLVNVRSALSIRSNLQRKLLQWMRETSDPVLDDFEFFLEG